MKALHIVDGDSTGGSLRLAGFGTNGKILSWRDALYTGPVPRGLTLRQLSRLRSRFWGGDAATAFNKRDARLARHADYEQIVLWFGATTLCQLSLIQLLAWFDEHSRGDTRLRLVSAYGGWLSPEQLLQVYDARHVLSPAQMRLGRKAWLAFCSPTPKAVSQLLSTDLRLLPELRETLSSMLQEYPEERSGLSRLERKLLRAVECLGVTTPSVAVSTIIRTDLVGDTLLFDMLRSFITARHSLLRFAEPFQGKLTRHEFNRSKISLTQTGRAVLAGETDHIALNTIDRWIGGVHLSGHRVRWRWYERIGRIVSRSEGYRRGREGN